MRSPMIAGIVILILGAIVLLQGASFTSRHDVLKVGDLKITATEKEWVPPWVGGMALVVGLGLIVAGTRKKT